MDICPTCENGFKRKYKSKGIRQIYCSRKCIYKGANVICICLTCSNGFIRNEKSRSKDKLYCSVACIQRSPCLTCGIMITGRKTFQSGEKRFCDRRCAAIWKGIDQTFTGYKVRGITAAILRTGEIACERCGDSAEHHLIVHHIDSDHKNIDLENLMLLCVTCHSDCHWLEKPTTRRRHISTANFLAVLWKNKPVPHIDIAKLPRNFIRQGVYTKPCGG